MLAIESECPCPALPPSEAAFPRFSGEQTRWGIILAGSGGACRRAPVHFVNSSQRSEQRGKGPFVHTPSGRNSSPVEPCISPEHTIMVLSGTGVRHPQGDVRFSPPWRLLPPRNRGTAPAVLLCLFHIIDREPEAMVAVLPCSDRRFNEPTFTPLLEASFKAAARHTDSVIRIVAQPRDPGAKLARVRLGPVRDNNRFQVGRFEERGIPSVAEYAPRERAPFNTLAVVGYAVTFLWMSLVSVPDLYAMLRMASVPCDEAGNLQVPVSPYSVLPKVDFFRQILSSKASRLQGTRRRGPDWHSSGLEDRVPPAERPFQMLRLG